MKLAQIENGLSYAGNTRKRNFEERACCPKPRMEKIYPSYGQLLVENNIQRQALKTACRMLVADEFVKSAGSCNK